MTAFLRTFSVTLLPALLLAACVQDDPRYPVYYSYRVDVKVDGAPVTIERVIKCTGTLVTGSTVAPGVTSGGTYRNPPLMGAYVGGTREAVYTPVVHACRWASSTAEERAEDAKKNIRSLDRPFTEQHDSLPPNSILPVLWVNDDQTLDQMEYYVSERALSGVDSHVEFVKAHPPVKVDKGAFRESEKRAATESPDLTPFTFPRDQNAAQRLQLYEDRFGNANHSHRVHAVCHAAWRITRAEWSEVEGLVDWVANLPKDGRAYLIDTERFGRVFRKTIPFIGGNGTPRLGPVGYVPESQRKPIGRFAVYETIHPVISTDHGRYVDLDRSGSFGCDYEVLFPDRTQSFWSNKTYSDDSPAGPSFSVAREGNLLRAAFSPLVPVYVRELDEFIVFMSLSVAGSIDEPVVKGWKE
ncbi:hypothetical protein E1180_07665 [Roseibium denhamense]|uniref:Uncharacterized protein n=1 Tax=Roseibium denhamense TaxID=76305 RepID=A0ABY1NV20_9HYPH|nr:hypothetical protein [Roseibium denhamense]MTI05391.1 hypothetical protein [Roseibium denhamense]SMP17710.1 hypothetical protein SAMN06265374_1845 [Roseibium denhamense]